MKTKYIYIALVALLGGIFWGCSDWTEAESKGYFEPPTKSYYEALRDYKKSDHEIAFGWFGNWTGVGASLVNCMRGIPDSVDLVSIWGNWRNLTEDQKADLKFCQETKGTKFLMCFIVANVGDQLTPAEVTEGVPEDKKRAAINAYWGWEDGNEAAIEAAIKKYVNMICDTIDKYNYDGFDIDYEANFGGHGNIAGGRGNVCKMDIFVKAMRERLGPDRLLVVDGEPQSLPAETGPYFDYFIIQAYECHGDDNLDDRLLYKGPNGTKPLVENFKEVMPKEEIARKLIMTENFEDFAQDGGVSFTDRYGNKMQSLEGMARWTPIIDGKKVRKGGIGTYHMEYDYPFNPEYKWLRSAIQIMNPSVK